MSVVNTSVSFELVFRVNSTVHFELECVVNMPVNSELVFIQFILN